MIDAICRSVPRFDSTTEGTDTVGGTIVTVIDELPSSTESFGSTDDPLSSTDDPLSSTDDPFSSTEDPLGSTEDPFGSTEDPVSTTEDPFGTTEDSLELEEESNVITTEKLITPQRTIPVLDDAANTITLTGNAVLPQIVITRNMDETTVCVDGNGCFKAIDCPDMPQDSATTEALDAESEGTTEMDESTSTDALGTTEISATTEEIGSEISTTAADDVTTDMTTDSDVDATTDMTTDASADETTESSAEQSTIVVSALITRLTDMNNTNVTHSYLCNFQSCDVICNMAESSMVCVRCIEERRAGRCLQRIQ